MSLVYDETVVTSRRSFLSTLAAAPLLAAPDQPTAPDWGVPVIDIHLHPRREDGGEVRHMEGCGVAKAVILGSATQVGQTKRRMDAAPGRMKFFASVDAKRTDSLDVLRQAVKDGAIGFGELKSMVPCDGPEMRRIYQLAADLNVPVLLHFQEGPPGQVFNGGIQRLGALLKANPKTTFIGHANSFWAHLSTDAPPDIAYPKGRIKPGGITDRLLADFPNLYGDLSANSGRNSLGRDPEFASAFLKRHPNKLMFGSDCPCRNGMGEGQVSQEEWIRDRCVARETLTALKKLTSPDLFRKIVHDNAAKLLKI
jgi:uncharacterized protein